MPTIDQLPPAVSVSDTDEFIVSQSDVARNATRAQILSGVQPALALPSNSLLGRVSVGVGSPEVINIGANLALSNGTLTAPSPFVIAGLGTGGAPSPSDVVPLSQGGQNAGLPYASFIGGIGTLTGISGSNLTVLPTGGLATRTLASICADAVTVESFGALGDGSTDDTAAFTAALASGLPLKLDGKRYIVNGPLVIALPAAIVGVAGATVIARTRVNSPAEWIFVSAASVAVTGVEFNAGSLGGGDMPAVSVSSSCTAAYFAQCVFCNSVGALSGSGLSIDTAAASVCTIDCCSFRDCALHGFYASGAGNLTISRSSAHQNGGCGLRAEAGLAFSARSNTCAGNSIGISVGTWTAGPGPLQGSSFTLSDNSCTANSQWGIAASGTSSILAGNALRGNGAITAGGGVLARLTYSRVTSNLVVGGGYGVDSRGCVACLIDQNHISATTTGLAAGGSQNLAIRSNALLSNLWGVVVSAIEPGLSFTPSGPITVSENWVGFSSPQGGGIMVTDGAQGIAVTCNDINGSGSATVDQAIWMHTDAAILNSNRFNNQARFKVNAGPVAGLQALVVPDVADDVLVLSAPSAIASILTAHQAETIGQVTFIKVTSGGSGYSHAQVAVNGTGGGAAASAVVSNGQITWIVMTNPGSGYGLIGAAATVTISGDGAGATATAYVGLPVIEGRQLRLSCNTQVQLALSGSAPEQQSWTGYASTIPAFGSVELEGTYGGWRAVAFPPVDYVSPTGDGGAIFQSTGGGSLILKPSSGGALHFTNDTDTVGCTSTIGRGSPLGIVSAPPGSDFRNLNGGAGNTFWVKQQNSDATGWAAIG